METNPNPPSASDIKTKENRRVRAERVLGVVLVLFVVALPVLFSQGFNPWTEISTPSPWAGTTGYIHAIGTPVPDGGDVIVGTVSLYASGGQNRARLDQSSPLPVATHGPGPIVIDYSGGSVNAGPTAPSLNGWCCFSEHAYSPDGQSLIFTGTAPGGLLHEIVFNPNGTVTTTRIDPTSNNDFTGDSEVTRTRFVTLTNSTDDHTTVVHSRPISNPVGWTQVYTQTTDTVFQNRHPGLAVDPFSEDFYLAYTNGTALNLVKYGLDQGQVLWELNNIVTLGSPPDAVFNHFQVVESEGHVAVLAPGDNHTSLWFAEDAGGVVPPSFTQTITTTFPGPPPGDHQAFALDGRMATVVRPAPDGTGTEIQHLNINPDPSVPPNVRIEEDDTIRGTWHNTVPSHAIFEDPREVLANQVYLMKGTEIFIVQGDQATGNIRYGTVTKYLHFDGFESGGTSFWVDSQTEGNSP